MDSVEKYLYQFDLKSFRELYDMYYEVLCKYALQLLHDPSLAEEVVDDEFMYLWTNRNRLNIKSIKTYLFRAVHNSCIDMLRSSKRRFSLSLFQTSATDSANFLDRVFVDDDHPLGQLLDKELEEEVRQSVDKLPDICKRVFMMSRVDHLKYHEISKVLGITVNTVKYHMKHALRLLYDDLSKYIYAILFFLLTFVSSCKAQKWTERQVDSFILVEQKGGPTMGYSPQSGVKILTVDGYAFKDLNRNGKLDAYEDWRRPCSERAADLASQLSVEEIAGLMLYSAHQAVPMAKGSSYHVAHYDGKPYEESGASPGSLTDEQKTFLKDDHLRAVLITKVENPVVAAQWNNNMQAYVEGLDHGIPVNTSSDPRHEKKAVAEFNAGAGGKISLWPSPLGLAATFDPALIRQFATIASEEYRALGITTALSPQVDIATEPRWWRFNGTFGEDPQLSADLARAYCEGFQTSPKSLWTRGEKGWGLKSVNAMAKHWYGYGAGEGGRDSHFANGKYAVYPGNNLAMHKRPFTEGAFCLKGGTKMASAVMPTYSILWQQDPSGKNVGGSYSPWLIQQQLRDEQNYDGVVCTDWNITGNHTAMDYRGEGKPWGAEQLTVAERHYRILQAGVDQFGGNNEMAPILEAYRLWSEQYGEQSARQRFELSARRLLMNILRVGLFENPYVDPEVTRQIVGNQAFTAKGYQTQLKSVVMVKNHNNATLPIANRLKVYVPQRHYPAIPSVWGGVSEEKTEHPIALDMVSRYYDVADSPDDADFALCLIEEPSISTGYVSNENHNENENGYIPISLQYNDYTATEARTESVAGGDPLETSANRSYQGKTVHTRNYDDLTMVRRAKERMGNKPVVVVVEVTKPVVLAELEPSADAILISFGVQQQVLLDLISGKAEPSGLLPMQLPADMITVETQQEDVPHDMRCLTDSDGHTYDFAYGLNWKGVINDKRWKKYKVK